MRLRTHDLSWQELDGHVVVLDLKGGVYLELNSSGSVLFNRLQDEADEPSLVEALVTSFGIDPIVAQRDVGAFLGLLLERDLLEA